MTQRTFEERDRAVWREFSEKVRSAASLQEAVAVLDSTPGVGMPGRRYFSNLAFFLLHSPFTLPGSADVDECVLCLSVTRMIRAQGLIGDEVVESVVSALKAKFPELER